jgi:glycosyltransferase involved in cell wall biosynthesis
MKTLSCIYPDLTVVILTYNSAKTIRVCLDSLCEQTYKEFSVTIIDDDSIDNTLQIVNEYSRKLRISVLRNGAHNIPRGRNIGLRSAKNGIVAFLDSDDTAQLNWTKIITATFRKAPHLAMISGEQVSAYHTFFAKAIAQNDETMRRFFGKGVLLFCTCNCAINRDILTDYYFDEKFVNAEDLEFLTRVEKAYKWQYVAELKVNHTIRDTLSKYYKQMYFYGMWKLFLSYRSSTFRIIDFIPLGVGILCLLTALLSPYFLVGLIFLPLAQTIVAIWQTKASFALWPNMFVAWCVKNIAWSLGIIVGFIKLKITRSLRLEAA